jgi:uncharacterized membrane protein YwzB
MYKFEKDHASNARNLFETFVWIFLWISTWNLVELGVDTFIEKHKHVTRSKLIVYVSMALTAASVAIFYTQE